MTKSTSTSEEDKSEDEVPRTEKWEIDTIGEFLLELFHKQEITIRDELMVAKSRLHDRFQEYLQHLDNKHLKKKFEDNYGSSFNIGEILYHTDFLRKNTPDEADYYQIKNDSLFQYRNEKLKEWDDSRRNGNHSIVSGPSGAQMLSNIETIPPDDTVANFKIDPALCDYLKVADDAKYHPLNYEGSMNQCKNADFTLSNMGCFICQRNFESADSFEKHIEWHGDDSDFESLKELKKEEEPFFHLSYAICQESHYFCFSLNTKEQNIIIEKIIVVRSNSFYYINKNEYVLDLEATGKFFVDSHLFTNSVIQPIVIVFRYQSSETLRFVEQHHFWRTIEFPHINFSIKANRLPCKSTFKSKFRLNQYLPSNEIKLALRNDFASKSLYNISEELSEYVDNGKELKISNICNVLNTLLQIEDMDGIKKYATLVQHEATLRLLNNFYTVRLKNYGRQMFENILTPYDEVIVIVNTDQMQSTKCNADLNLDMILRNEDDFREIAKNRNLYFGIVEKVSGNRVTFSSHKKINENVVDKIIFRPARLTLRYQYRAIEYLDLMKPSEKLRVFFPISGGNENPENLELELFNTSIAENHEQYQAVKNISAGPTKNATYIIFGPPGTGKTSTVVEGVLQLYKRRPETKILVTAGSNSACDEVAFRLCKVLTDSDDTRAIVRIFAKSNEKRLDNIDEMLIEASNMYGAHFYPDINVLHEYRIVVCTLSVVGKLSTGRFGRNPMGDGIYTHIFVDEVAASTEAETLVGISSTISSNSHVIISGDHKQLGPILQSDRARELGLNVSLMERLLKRDCYKVDERGNYDSSIQTRLIRNYRSHPEIVKLYNELYYNGELIPMAKEDDVNLGKLWHSSPNSNFPIIFHNVFGNCSHDKKSTSLYNGDELEVVMNYVRDLMCYGINGEKIEQQDIGIISPYKRQYLRIQEELNLLHLYRIETGSVETFQGKEKDIIIVSFVRSFTSTIGFLNDPQRLNVTLSRAKSLLILIGNPETLSVNDDFKFIIEKCRKNKTIIEEKEGKQMKNATCSDLNIAKIYTTIRYSKAELLKYDSHGSSVLYMSTDDDHTAYKIISKKTEESFADPMDHDLLVNQYLYDSSGSLIEHRVKSVLGCMRPCWKCKNNFLTGFMKDRSQGNNPSLQQKQIEKKATTTSTVDSRNMNTRIDTPLEKESAYTFQKDVEPLKSNENISKAFRYSKTELIVIYMNACLDFHDLEVNGLQYASKGRVRNAERNKVLHQFMRPCWLCLNNFLTKAKYNAAFENIQSQLHTIALESKKMKEPDESIILKEDIVKTMRYSKEDLLKLYVHEYSHLHDSSVNRYSCIFKGTLKGQRIEVLKNIVRACHQCRQCQHNLTIAHNITLQHTRISDKDRNVPIPPSTALITTANQSKVVQNAVVDPVQCFHFNVPAHEIDSTSSVEVSEIFQHGGAIPKQACSIKPMQINSLREIKTAFIQPNCTLSCIQAQTKDGISGQVPPSVIENTEPVTYEYFHFNVPSPKPVVINRHEIDANRSIGASQISQQGSAKSTTASCIQSNSFKKPKAATHCYDYLIEEVKEIDEYDYFTTEEMKFPERKKKNTSCVLV